MKKNTRSKDLQTVRCKFEFRKLSGWRHAEFLVEVDNGWQRARATKSREKEFEKFQGEFIRTIQEAALNETSENRRILVPVNYVPEFLTSKFMHKLADAIRRPRKRPAHLVLKIYLRAAWQDKDIRFNQMTREELAANLNAFFPQEKITPNAAWQMAYRLGLFSKRTSGPKQVAGGL